MNETVRQEKGITEQHEAAEQEKVRLDNALWEELDLEVLDDRVEFYVDPGGGYCCGCWVHYR